HARPHPAQILPAAEHVPHLDILSRGTNRGQCRSKCRVRVHPLGRVRAVHAQVHVDRDLIGPLGTRPRAMTPCPRARLIGAGGIAELVVLPDRVRSVAPERESPDLELTFRECHQLAPAIRRRSRTCSRLKPLPAVVMRTLSICIPLEPSGAVTFTTG